MWEKFRRNYPILYETVEWAEVALSIVTFLLALSVYLRG